MMTFWIVAVMLSLLASAFVFVPMLFSGKTSARNISDDQVRSTVNIDIFKQRLAELETSRAELAITDEIFAQLKVELEQELLSVVQPEQESGQLPEPQAAASSTGKKIPLLCAIFIPLLAFFLYADWGLSFGSINDVEVAQDLAAARQPGHTPGDMAAVIQRLRKSLARQPENDEGWFMLARSLSSLGEYEQSADAFKALLDRYPQDDSLSSYYAESLYMADARQITSRVRKAIDATLALAPESPNILEILGMEAYASGDYALAISYFERVAVQNISAERAKMLQQGITEARKKMGESGSTPATTPATAPASMTPASQQSLDGAPASQHIDVLVEIATGLPVAASDTVYVFAKAAAGPPMPLAVEKLTVADLPKMVRLDDSMSMVPEMKISNVGEIRIVARVSSSGSPTAAPGDYQARSESLTVDKQKSVVKLIIADVVK